MALMIFFSIILIIGLITTFTDLKSKKIYNQHLVLGAVAGIIATAYTAVFRHENVLFHISSGLLAFLVGFLMHRFALWRGGDAKLFTLYAFLMPPSVYDHLLFPSALSLFACSFLAGTVILLPIFIKDIIIHHKTIGNDLVLPTKREALFRGVMRITFYSWVLFPIYYLARIYLASTLNPVIILTISYLLFKWRYEIRKKVGKHYIIEFFKKEYVPLSIGLAWGFLTRLLLSPNSLSFSALTRYFIMIMLSAGLSICIDTTFNHFKDYHERVGFAPLLFIGCILTYTPFLTWIMDLTHLVLR